MKPDPVKHLRAECEKVLEQLDRLRAVKVSIAAEMLGMSPEAVRAQLPIIHARPNVVRLSDIEAFQRKRTIFPATRPLVGEKEDRFLDKEQLRKRLNLISTRGVDEMMRTKRIPFLRLGHRTVRFDWPEVEKALASERKAA